MNILIEHIKNSILSCVGYAEAKDKESFKVGAQVGFSKAEDYFTEIIKALELKNQVLETEAMSYKNDLQTVSDIIIKYSQD